MRTERAPRVGAMMNFDTGEGLAEPGPTRLASRLVRLPSTTATEPLGAETVAPSSELEFVELALHDLQNAVALLDASMRLLTTETLLNGRDSHHAVRDAQLAVRRIQRYIDHLVTSERISCGAFGARRRRVSLAPVLAELVEEYEYHARSWGITLSLEMNDADELAVLADDVLIGRVFQNLTENALRHNRQGGRALVRTRLTDDGVELRFCNDGDPISPGDRRRVFDKFVGNRRRGTAGIGLYFSRVAVVASGGSIAVEDQPGWPVCIVVRLPRY